MRQKMPKMHAADESPLVECATRNSELWQHIVGAGGTAAHNRHAPDGKESDHEAQ